MSNIKTKYEQNNIIPDVIQQDKFNNNVALLNIKYGNNNVNLGNELTPTQVKHSPSITIPNNIDQNSYYTLAMLDPGKKYIYMYIYVDV